MAIRRVYRMPLTLTLPTLLISYVAYPGYSWSWNTERRFLTTPLLNASGCGTNVDSRVDGLDWASPTLDLKKRIFVSSFEEVSFYFRINDVPKQSQCHLRLGHWNSC